MMKAEDPWLPFGLGFAGLIPFWGLALAHTSGVPFGSSLTASSTAIATYAATILSFLGGIRWGLAIRTNNQTMASRDYAMSVVPQLSGWVALALSDPFRLIALAALLVGLGLLDHDLVTRGIAPGWFGRLRLVLSLGASGALLVTAFG